MRKLTSQRAFYSIDETILDEFNRLVPASKRSKLVQNLMEKFVAQNDFVLEQATRLIENDPSYSAVNEDVAAFSFDTLSRL
jgi:hypothetical protein